MDSASGSTFSATIPAAEHDGSPFVIGKMRVDWRRRLHGVLISLFQTF